MPENNQAQDRYNPPKTTESDFQTFNFSDLPVGELFWLDTNPNGEINIVHRKVDENSGMQLKTRNVTNFDSKLKIYQKS